MKQQTFHSFEKFLYFFRYMEPGTVFRYVSQDAGGLGQDDTLVIEVSEEDFNKAKEEYEADSYSGFDYI